MDNDERAERLHEIAEELRELASEALTLYVDAGGNESRGRGYFHNAILSAAGDAGLRSMCSVEMAADEIEAGEQMGPDEKED